MITQSFYSTCKVTVQRYSSKLNYVSCLSSKRYLSLSNYLLKNKETVSIGGVVKDVIESKNQELVPKKYLSPTTDQSTLKKLRWMLQKDVIGQDMFLIGPPGPEKFKIARTFAEFINQEVEYVALSRDTTESDLKQRREIKKGTASFEDQAAVRAAVHGRLLILDGIEKTERNVLPVLNNLLENREMPLEDGRLLISSSRYDQLLKDGHLEDSQKWKLIRVNENFRVIALGLPVPKYKGHPLDPPLRSRFQALNMSPKTFKEQLAVLQLIAPNRSEEDMIQLASFAYAINGSESKAQGLPDFPVGCLPIAASLMESSQNVKVDQAISRLYPYKTFLSKDGQTMVHDLMDNLAIHRSSDTIDGNRPDEQLEISSSNYVNNDYHDSVIQQMSESMRVHDLCLIGPRGSGKSTLVAQLAERLSLDIEPIMLYQDMTARDLLQQRSTLANGDTIWRPSSLLTAALQGKIAVLDGLHRLNSGTLFSIQSLIHEREAQLFDGSRILRHDRYDDIQRNLGCTDQEMAEKKLFRIHENFRIVALAEPPSLSGKNANHWLSPETLSMFLYHSLRPLKVSEEVKILESLIKTELPAAMHLVIKLAQHLRSATDPNLHSLASSLSTRQLLRIAKRLKEYPNSNAHDLVERACLWRFLPRLPQEALLKAMKECGLERCGGTSEANSLQCQVNDGYLTIGQTKAPVYQKGNQAKVPDVVFYDTNQHLRVLECLLQDFLLGDHLLLVGNQGVGKNRVIDRLLALMNRPREYIQLHRDTTVQSLTVQPTVSNGIVTFQDSALVRAARDGSVLLVDEADKAPTQVTCILKTLIENGEMLLADGRRILPVGVKNGSMKEADIIRLHPDFRVIVLANRPGFPFLGNDFFASLGDLFSVLAVENPELESELELLRHFGPDVPDEMLRQLVQAFSKLRSMADQGQLSYPYSTREVINVVKHMQRYPNDGLVRVVSNVFDFDAYSNEVKETIMRVFHEQGIPLGASTNNVALAVQVPLAAPVIGGEWTIRDPLTVTSWKKPLGSTGRFSTPVASSNFPPSEARLLWFTEQKHNWKLPFGDTQFVHGVAVTDNNMINVVTTSPAVMYSIDVKDKQLIVTPLDRYLDIGFYNNISNLQIATLKNVILIFDPETSKLVMIDPIEKSAELASLKETSNSLGRLSQKWMGKSDSGKMAMCSTVLPDLNTVIFFQPRGHRVELLNPDEKDTVVFELDFQIESVFPVMTDRLIIQEADSNRKFLFDVKTAQLMPIEESQPLGLVTSKIIGKADGNALFTVQDHYGAVMAIPQNTLQLWPGNENSKEEDVVLLPHQNMVVSSVPLKAVPKSINKEGCSGFLQVADLDGQTLRYIPMPTLEQRRYARKNSSKAVPWHQTAFTNDSVITVDNNGWVRLWEVNASRLAKSLNSWRSIVGDGGGEQLTIKRNISGDVSGPKVGQVDPTGNPHVGGNTWAGGTGGRDTAGLGGRGGPYRLDAGHPVHQVSDEDKAAVPEEVLRAAREMGQKAYKERLKQIKMDPVDADLYQQFSASVQKQVQSLRVILGSLQAKGKERQWVKHQTFGDLDDTKLIEGITGEKNIYRRRAERHPELGTPSEKPKHLRLLVDVSGSMYRFNGYDRRLEREMAAVLLFMEALEGHSSQWRYDIIGHSGETPDLELVSSARPPKDEKQRMDVLLNMHAHSQFCMSGDHTLEATRQSISSLNDLPDIDEAFVIVLSDANLERYGIPASHLAESLTSTENVRASIVFIGSLGDQAVRLSHRLPAGSAYVCMDLEKLPQILQQVFTSVLTSK